MKFFLKTEYPLIINQLINIQIQKTRAKENFLSFGSLFGCFHSCKNCLYFSLNDLFTKKS
ncbi:MAG: hypothetical protein RL403_1780 [Bacteroidota bacterium]|jgi:hypothetical protein